MDSSSPHPSDPPALSRLEHNLGYQFQERARLERALTHPSFSQLPGVDAKHNQRLEFLGDAVLGMILAEQLFQLLPGEREGILTKYRSALAKGVQLSALARQLGLPEALRLSEAEERNAGRDRDSILEDALEATIGAIYLDSDYPTTRDVVLTWYGDIKERLAGVLNAHNPKGRLQEIVQPRLGNEAITYTLVEESGPDHRKRFTVHVHVSEKFAGEGNGTSKKEAEEAAALAALDTVEALLA